MIIGGIFTVVNVIEKEIHVMNEHQDDDGRSNKPLNGASVFLVEPGENRISFIEVKKVPFSLLNNT